MTINKELLIDCLNRIIRKREFFYSEADFQHELAFAIHKKIINPNVEIHLERPIKNFHKEYCIDILIIQGDLKFAIELKYKTKNSVRYNEIKNHSGHGAGRYDFLKDIYRIEKLKKDKKIDKGFCAFFNQR